MIWPGSWGSARSGGGVRDDRPRRRGSSTWVRWGAAFVGIASAGFDSEANRIANAAPPRLGNLVYAYGALRALVSWRPAHFEIVLDRQLGTTSPATRLEPRARGPTAEGCGAPAALLDDGLLDIASAVRRRARFLVTAEGLQGHARQRPRCGCSAPEVAIRPTGPSRSTPTATRSASCRCACAPSRARCCALPDDSPQGAPFLASEDSAPRLPLAAMKRRWPQARARTRVWRLSRLRGGGATSVPGKALLRLEPDAIGVLGARACSEAAR